jgi:hypothetical protein
MISGVQDYAVTVDKKGPYLNGEFSALHSWNESLIRDKTDVVFEATSLLQIWK